jgi:HEAT repeat protein
MSEWMLDLALKGTVVLGLGLVAARALGGRPAAVRHALLVATAAAAAALPALTLTLPGWNVPLLAERDAPAPARVATPAPDVSAGSRVAMATPDASPNPIAVGELRPPPRRDDGTPWVAALAAAWAGGAFLVIARFALDVTRTRLLVRDAVEAPEGIHARLAARIAERMNVRRGVRILFSEGLSVPVTWGIVRPVVVLPLEAWEWPAERIRIALLHEIAHVRRLDCLSSGVAVLASALWWFHPLQWVCRRRLRVEQERACDDVVLLDGVGAAEYASLLVDFARGLSRREETATAGAAIAMARRSTLRDRVETILAAGSRSLRLEPRTAGLLALAAVTLLLPLAAVRVWGETAEARRVSELRADLESSDAAARQAAAWGLGALNAKEAAGPLRARLADPDPRVRGVAARSLGRIGGADAFAPIAELLADPDPFVRELAILGLEATGSGQVVSAVMPLLADPEMGVRSVAVSALGHAEGREAARALAAVVVGDPDDHTRVMAAGALAKRVGEPDLAVPALVQLLGDADPGLRAEAAWALDQLASEAAVAGLAAQLAREPDPEVRSAIVQALAAFPAEPRALERLLAALRDPHPGVRNRAALGLAGSDDPNAAAALVAALRDPVHQVRLQAAWGLDEIEARR